MTKCPQKNNEQSQTKILRPQARKDFIAAVTARADLLGLSDKAGTLEVAPAQTQGDVTVIAGQAWPAKVDAQRNQLACPPYDHDAASGGEFTRRDQS